MDSPVKTSPIPGAKPPWKPGQSGNPSGRPKKTAQQKQYEDVLQHKFQSIMTADEIGEVLESLLRDAKSKGNYRSKELVLAYALGKPTIKIEHQKSGIDRIHELLDQMPDVIVLPQGSVTGATDDTDSV